MNVKYVLKRKINLERNWEVVTIQLASTSKFINENEKKKRTENKFLIC